MKETNELVIHAALVDGKHLEFKVNVEAGNEDLAKVFAGLVFTVAQGMKQSLMENGLDSEDANDATWGLLDAAFATAKYDKGFARMMNHEHETEKSKDEGIAVIAIGNDEAIPDKWAKALKELVRELREQERGED
jgi:hypothetical protein